MPRESTKAAGYKSEAEEADWYATPEGRRRTAREFSRTLRTGTLIPSAGENIPKTDPALVRRLMEQAIENATCAISIPVPVADPERARRIAEEKGVGCQTVLKRAIREGLPRAGVASAVERPDPRALT